MKVDESKLDKINVFLCTEFGIECSRRINPNVKTYANDLK